MSLKADFLQLQWLTEYEGKDLYAISKKMRKIKPAFSDKSEFLRDIQVTFDENYINYVLFTLLYEDKPFSLTEVMLDKLPDSFMGAGAAIKAIMNTQVFGLIFKELTHEFGNRKPLDLRCGLNKEYLN